MRSEDPRAGRSARRAGTQPAAPALPFRSLEERRTCARCLADPWLAAWAAASAERGHCTYCGEHAPLRAMDALVPLVLQGIASEWEPGAAPAEPGAHLVVVGTSELVLRWIDPVSGRERVRADLLRALPDTLWRLRDPWWASARETLAWSAFEELAKHRRRFFFGCSEDPGDADAASVRALFERLRQGVRACDLTRVLPRGTEIQRVRIAAPGVAFARAAELGPPPARLALRSNRMSPPGIAMFYGAFDEETAVAETWEPAQGRATASVATFRSLRPLRVLDLVELPSFPSLYDPLRRGRRPFLGFVREFAERIARPIERDGRFHLDDVPTQVLTEYLRLHPMPGEPRPLDGVLWPSARRRGRSCALFLEAADCVDSLRRRPVERRPPSLLLVAVHTREL